MLEGQVKEAKQMVEESDIKYDEVEFWHCLYYFEFPALLTGHSQCGKFKIV